MKSKNINIEVENFRAINKADISIDGITLVAGENGCGKSTISKLLYFLFNTALNYERIIKNNLVDKLGNFFRFLQISQQDIFSAIEDRKLRKKLQEKHMGAFSENMLSTIRHKDLNASQDILLEQISSLKEIYSDIILPNNYNSNRLQFRIQRLVSIINDITGKPESIDNETQDLLKALDNICEYIKKTFSRSINKIENRPISVFKEELIKNFKDKVLPKKFNIKEFEDEIISFEHEKISIPYNIQNVIYIDNDNPIVGYQDSFAPEHWEHLISLLKDDTNEVFDLFNDFISENEEQLYKHISKTIKGEVFVSDEMFNADFKFKREDGSIFSLNDVATGIKSFSILQLLLKNRHLNNKTLLIIDEPESNLHPHWIVEYARLLVMIHKHIGVKLFLASHNPDMVSAIRFIAQKENVLENTIFYLAEESNKYAYTYKNLGVDIDPIFESFNKAIDKINEYGI